RRSGRSFVIENTPGSGRVRRGDSRCADGKKLGPFVLGTFRGRILNTHPALLPRFGGRGMYGDRVFEAVLEAGEAESGVSIHLVDAEYDTGPVPSRRKHPR